MTRSNSVLLAALAACLAIPYLARPTVPPNGPRLERRFEDVAREVAEREDAKPAGGLVQRSILAQGQGGLPSPTVPQTSCTVTNHRRAESGSLYDRVMLQLLLTAASIQVWLATGEWRSFNRDYQQMVEKIDGIVRCPGTGPRSGSR